MMIPAKTMPRENLERAQKETKELRENLPLVFHAIGVRGRVMEDLVR